MDQISVTTSDDQLSLDPLSLLDDKGDDGSRRSDEPLNEAGYAHEVMSNEDSRGCCEEEPEYAVHEEFLDGGSGEEPLNEYYVTEPVDEPYQDDGRGQEEQEYEPYEDDDTGSEETSYEPDENDGRGWEEQPPYEPQYVSPQFEQDYICFPISHIDKHHLEDGNKILMPASALGRLMDLRIEEYPMVFEINSPSSGRVSHCGVLEFSAEEGFVLLPNWMMMNMNLQEGDMVNLRNVSLPKGEYMKIQPHETKFVMNIKNPKDVLEAVLKDFTCVSAGDTIMITHEGQKYYIDIVETKPSYGVSLFETDCEVEFATPLDYKEPEKKPAASVIETKKTDQRVEEKEEPKFKAFTGVGRRLDGQTIVKNEANEPNAAMKLGKKKANVEDEHKSTSKEEGKMFQPFTGKKYTLGG